MLDKRLRIPFLIFLTICISIWRIATPDPLQLIEQDSKTEADFQSENRNGYFIPLVTTSSQLPVVTGSSLVSTAWTNTTTIIRVESLPTQDFHTLIDLHNFEFLINQPACGENGPSIIILVHSATENIDKRSVIRQTWGSVKNSKIRLLFLLGAVESQSRQSYISAENTMFKDIVQGNFIDAYKNITYKHIMAFKWFNYFCPNAKYLVKVDDDIYVNTLKLTKFFSQEDQPFYQVPTNSISHVQTQNLIFCHTHEWSRIKRSFRSKWRVSTREFPGRYYPPYCPGYAIVYSADVVFKLYVEGQKSPYFWIDDVHVTGTLAKKSNIPLLSFSDYILTSSKFKEIADNEEGIDDQSFLFSWSNISREQIKHLWYMTVASNIGTDVR